MSVDEQVVIQKNYFVGINYLTCAYYNKLIKAMNFLYNLTIYIILLLRSDV